MRSRLADRALIVTTPEVSAIRDADRIIGLLEANDIHKIRSGDQQDTYGYGRTWRYVIKDDVLDILAVDLIGIVPDDENIVISTNRENHWLEAIHQLEKHTRISVIV